MDGRVGVHRSGGARTRRPGRPTLTDRLGTDETLIIFTLIVVLAISGPLQAEFLFRGYVFRALRNSQGVWPARSRPASSSPRRISGGYAGQSRRGPALGPRGDRKLGPVKGGWGPECPRAPAMAGLIARWASSRSAGVRSPSRSRPAPATTRPAPFPSRHDAGPLGRVTRQHRGTAGTPALLTWPRRRLIGHRKERSVRSERRSASARHARATPCSGCLRPRSRCPGIGRPARWLLGGNRGFATVVATLTGVCDVTLLPGVVLAVVRAEAVVAGLACAPRATAGRLGHVQLPSRFATRVGRVTSTPTLGTVSQTAAG
ncbi:hypothetical protein BH20ACT16_BH20ACT16_11750 [soil metagenome]|jgi:hypothetical protein